MQVCGGLLEWLYATRETLSNNKCVIVEVKQRKQWNYSLIVPTILLFHWLSKTT